MRPALALADRLHANLRAAGIPATDEDIERVLSDGGLERAERHVDVLRGVEDGDGPDYLASWAPDPNGVSARPADAPRSAADQADGGATVASLGPRIESGEVSPVDLTTQALDRIEARDHELNAFQLVLAERALDAARLAEAEIAAGGYRGPLHGVPVAVKDLLAMRDTVTAAGSRVLGDNVTTFDAAAVERLEAAGAIVVGKTRLPEFAFLPGSANPHYGPTANPHDPGRDAGGSSSGSGVAVQAGMALAALGTDTGGSIRIPAAVCGVVGLKPTFGRVSLFGCVPLAWSLDHVGPLTRSVEDAALILAALAGGDPRDRRTRPGTAFGVPANLRQGVKGMRVGVPSGDGSARVTGSEAALDAWRASCGALEAAGASLVEVELPDLATLRAASFLILAVEAATLHTSGLQSRYDEYGEPCRDRLIGGFAYGARDLLQAQRFRGVARDAWNGLLKRVDVLSTPAQPDVAPPLGVAASTRYTNAFNALGWPAVSVPFGAGEGGLPLATQLVGRPWDEATLLRAAQALEEARDLTR